MTKPKFKWSKSKRRYLYANGKAVPDDKVRDWAQAAIDRSKERIAGTTEMMVDGSQSVTDWTKAMKIEIEAAHRAMARLANGGKLDKKAEARLAKLVKAQNDYLKQFASGLKSGAVVKDGKVSPRAQMYAQAARPTYENEVRAREQAAGMKQERRVLSVEESCRSSKGKTGCVEIAAKGWKKTGTLPAIGTATCLVNCLCRFEFK